MTLLLFTKVLIFSYYVGGAAGSPTVLDKTLGLLRVLMQGTLTEGELLVLISLNQLLLKLKTLFTFLQNEPPL